MTVTEELAAWAAGLTFDEIPPRVVATPQPRGIPARRGPGEPGPRVGQGRRRLRRAAPGDPKQAAYTLAALTIALDFDDTVYAGHVSHSTVDVPVAYQAYLASTGGDSRGVVAATECAARVTADATLGPFRGQTAAHAHLVGAVAARLRAEGAPPERFVDAWGIALAMPPWSLHRAFLGSDAKVLTASVPVRTGLDACDAAAAGLVGAADVVEHPDGFLARFATVPLPEAATAGLGRGGTPRRRRSRCTRLRVHQRRGRLRRGAGRPGRAALPADVGEVVVHSPIFTVGMDARSAPYVRGADSAVSTSTSRWPTTWPPRCSPALWPRPTSTGKRSPTRPAGTWPPRCAPSSTST